MVGHSDPECASDSKDVPSTYIYSLDFFREVTITSDKRMIVFKINGSLGENIHKGISDCSVSLIMNFNDLKSYFSCTTLISQINNVHLIIEILC